VEVGQTLRSKILRKITNAPFYVSNQTIHSDLIDYAIEKYRCLHHKLPIHPNPLARNLQSLHIPGNPIRRLNRRCRERKNITGMEYQWVSISNKLYALSLMLFIVLFCTVEMGSRATFLIVHLAVPTPHPNKCFHSDDSFIRFHTKNNNCIYFLL
jgi:hypothetical protein